MLFIQSYKSDELRKSTYEAGIIERSIKGKRGQIYDRNGGILAETINKYTFWVNSNEEYNNNKIIDLFSSELQQSKDIFNKLLHKKKSYVKIAGGLLETQCKNILSQINDIKGLRCDLTTNRYYPYENITSQVLGYVDKDNRGQFGIEHQFDSILRGEYSQHFYNRSASGRLNESIQKQKPINNNGDDIHLTLDIEIQAILVNALHKGLTKSKASSANGIIINPFSGEILAMASVPDFNPNNYNSYNINTFINRSISEAYEPGSTFKLIAMTAILESGLFNINDIIYCEQGEFQILPNKLIHDHEPHGDLSISEIFIHSSNIGIAKLIKQLGAEQVYDYARKFGFGIKTGISLPGESSGLLRKYDDWSNLSGTSVSIGQEISANTLQLALAYAAAANGGYLPEPRIIQDIDGNNFKTDFFNSKAIRRVMSKNTSNTLLMMMESVVIKGTASNAQIPGYEIGGKTGTAEKFINGAYSTKEFISSFAAVFPVNKPKYVCVVSVDAPTYGYHWGNETAAPIVKKIIERLIINKKIDIEESKGQFQYAKIMSKDYPMKLTSANSLNVKTNNLVPDFIGQTLKQSVKTAQLIGLNIQPIGVSGRVVWQSIDPGQKINNSIKCKIKLETL